MRQVSEWMNESIWTRGSHSCTRSVPKGPHRCPNTTSPNWSPPSSSRYLNSLPLIISPHSLRACPSLWLEPPPLRCLFSLTRSPWVCHLLGSCLFSLLSIPAMLPLSFSLRYCPQSPHPTLLKTPQWPLFSPGKSKNSFLFVCFGTWTQNLTLLPLEPFAPPPSQNSTQAYGAL
jgi:hypothetical protein